MFLRIVLSVCLYKNANARTSHCMQKGARRLLGDRYRLRWALRAGSSNFNPIQIIQIKLKINKKWIEN